MTQFGVPKFRLLGTDALVLESPGSPSLARQARIWSIFAATRDWEFVVERVPGLNTITILFDATATDAHRLQTRLLEAWNESSEAAVAGRHHEIGVRYGGDNGPDLADVARITGLSERDVVAKHCTREYSVYFLGFQPGFAYLGDLDPALHVPRRSRPRRLVRAGSVAIGGTQTAIYPFDSPGGWNIIGASDVALFDARRDPAALFAPGDSVRFVEIV